MTQSLFKPKAKVIVSVPKVLNKKVNPIIGPSDVYIGRPSPWGNPFVIGKDGRRLEVIKKYIKYLLESNLTDSVGELAKKNLVCWCSPLPCHGHVLLHLANPFEKDLDIPIEIKCLLRDILRS